MLGEEAEGAVCKKIQNYVFSFADLLGQGNFSKVYKARNEVTNEVVAIKIVQLESLKSKKLQELLFSEINILKQLNHPNVLRCHEVFTSNRNCYIITELCSDGDLESHLRKERFLPEHKAAPFIRDIFAGLLYLAEKGVVHRDLKVANVFLHRDRAKIADFGFAKFTTDSFKDISIGSPIYMSPEGFIHNTYGPKTDVWALGVLLFELLHGQTPFSHCRTQQQLKLALLDPVTPNRLRYDLSPQLKEAILKCLQVDHVKRPTVSQLVELLYFKRLLQPELPVTSNQGTPSQLYGSASDLRHRSPSCSPSESKFLLSKQGFLKRRTSQGKPQSSPYAGQTVAIERPVFLVDIGVPRRTMNPPDGSKEGRTASSEKWSGAVRMEPVVAERQMRILSGELSFKECVNVLHYGRLVFKFLVTLKVSDYSNENELSKLSKWLMELFAEIKIKIERKQVVYEGENSELREQKLKEVRQEYEKKYRTELDNYVSATGLGEHAYSLSFIKDYCFALYQKYDGLIAKEQNRSLLTLGHCIILMVEGAKLLQGCFQSKNYRPFLSFKEIEGFLSVSRDRIDLNSYLGYRKKMLMYS